MMSAGFSPGIKSVAIFAAAATLLAGCGKKDDSISQAARR
jgi:hypothetical protein